MTTYEHLHDFINNQMRMSQVYQPVMLIELLKRNGEATVTEIAQAILDKDPTQLEYFSKIVKAMPGRVLSKNRGITEQVGDTYFLKGAVDLTPEQAEALMKLCKSRIEHFESKRGDAAWEHRKRGHRPISGSVRYNVLKRAKFRCELCGIAADVKPLEVDHIHPKSLGGKDDLSNYQGLCYSCNAAKGNKDDEDFRGLKKAYAHRDEDCLFCEVQTEGKSRVVAESTLAYAIRDGFPVTEGHTLVIPKRHIDDYFGLTQAEINAVNQLLADQKEKLQQADCSIDGFNVGMNCGESAGQTVFHCHIHLIPRRTGDIANPRGGVRNTIPGKGAY
jgi:ATP adenylyltransferase